MGQLNVVLHQWTQRSLESLKQHQHTLVSQPIRALRPASVKWIVGTDHERQSIEINCTDLILSCDVLCCVAMVREGENSNTYHLYESNHHSINRPASEVDLVRDLQS